MLEIAIKVFVSGLDLKFYFYSEFTAATPKIPKSKASSASDGNLYSIDFNVQRETGL